MLLCSRYKKAYSLRWDLCWIYYDQRTFFVSLIFQSLNFLIKQKVIVLYEDTDYFHLIISSSKNHKFDQNINFLLSPLLHNFFQKQRLKNNEGNWTIYETKQVNSKRRENRNNGFQKWKVTNCQMRCI